MSAAEPCVHAGLVGYGFVGQTFHAPLIEATFGWRLSTIVSGRPAAVRADRPDVRVLETLDQALADPALDVIVIAAPNAQHAPMARAALAAGKHVVVDKPFTLDLSEARALVDAAAQAGRLISVFQNRRWDSDFLAVRAAIEAGAIGEVVHFESHIDRFRPTVKDRWRERAAPGGGLWFDLGPHLIDQALQLFGLPRAVHARLAVRRPGGQATDWAHVVLDYPNRCAILHASMLVAGGAPRFVVHGTAGSLVKNGADIQEDQLRAGVRPGQPGWGVDNDTLWRYTGDDTPPTPRRAPAGDQRAYYEAFGAAVRGQADNPVPPRDALAVMAVIEAAITSDHAGRACALPLTAAERAAWPAPS